MLAKAKNQLRSWMFVYLGLVATIILSDQPANDATETRLEGYGLPVIMNAPLQRRDI